MIDLGDGEHWVSTFYLARLVAGEPRNCEPDKHAEVAWFPLDRPPEPLAIAARERLLRARRRLNGRASPHRNRATAIPHGSRKGLRDGRRRLDSEGGDADLGFVPSPTPSEDRARPEPIDDAAV